MTTFNFEEGATNRDSNSFQGEQFKMPPGSKAVGYAFMTILAVVVVYGLVKAAAGVAILMTRGVILVSLGAAVIAALVATVQVIGEAYGDHRKSFFNDTDSKD